MKVAEKIVRSPAVQKAVRNFSSEIPTQAEKKAFIEGAGIGALGTIAVAITGTALYQDYQRTQVSKAERDGVVKAAAPAVSK